MSIRLHYAPKTRAGRVRWLLEELEAPHELIHVDRAGGQCDTPDYRQVHPLGKVPALEDGETTLIESAAICMHLADRFADKGLAPAPGTPERGCYYQWMVYCVATLEPAAVAVFTASEENKPAAQESFAAVLGVLEAALTEGPYLLGESFSAADVLIGSVMAWGKPLGWIDDMPALQAYADRVLARPAKQRAAAGDA